MNALEFIDSVVPSGGTYCIIGVNPTKKEPNQKFANNLADVQKIIDSIDQSTTNTYFAVSSFKDNSSRKQTNVQEIKSFFLDIDISTDANKLETKQAYADKAEALSVVRTFINETGLPLPAVVDSGGGWHLYWILDTAITVDKWQPIADLFKQLCIKSGLHIDPRVPADSARVLRVVGTNNTKYGIEAKFLEGISIPNPIALTQFETPLRGACAERGISEIIRKPKVNFEMDATTAHLLGNKAKKFSTIAIKSLKGEGCMQIKHALEKPNGLHYDLWCAALSVANTCDDGDVAIHKLSKGHDGYSFEATEAKAAEFDNGPRRCEWYLQNFPRTCEGCKHVGQIVTPVKLGESIAESTADEILIMEPEPTIIPEPIPTLSGIITEELGHKLKIPKLPFPYFRMANGGIAKKVKGDDGEADEEVIYANDLFVMKRVKDVNEGEVLIFNLVLPQDGLHEFAIPLKCVASIDRLRDALAHHGVAVTTRKGMENIMAYIIAANNELQRYMKADVSHPQFGWCEKDTKFVIGRREITPTGSKYSPPSAKTASLAGYLEPTGDYDVWKSVMEVLARPGWEHHQLGGLIAFGAPLMQFTAESGMTFNFVNDDSGTGKTLIQHFINSVYGNTTHLMLRKSDTLASRYDRLGVMCNLPTCMDELTNLTAMETSDFTYSVSEGRAKNRMESGSNKERVNTAWWKTLVAVSSNASMVDKLTTNKAMADGELHRIFEYEISKPEELDPDYAQGLSLALTQNYGHAGDIYLKAVLRDVNGTKALQDKIRKIINREIKAKSSERMWIAGISSKIAGGYIAKSLGIITWDMDKLFKLVIKELKLKRGEAASEKMSFNSVLGEFLSEHKGAILQINGKADARSGIEQAPIFNPNIRIIGRYEPDTSRLYILQSAFKDYCVKRQIPYNSAVIASGDDIKFIEKKNVRIMKGTGLNAPSVPVVVYEAKIDLGIPQDETAD